MHDLRRRAGRGLLGEVPGRHASASSSGSGETSAINAAGDDPVLRATAIALAKALGQEVEKARKQQTAADDKPKAARSGRSRKTQRKPARGGKAKPDEEIPEAIPTVDPPLAARADARADRRPTAAPTAAAAPPAATAPPATPTPTAAPGPGRRAARLPLRR